MFKRHQNMLKDEIESPSIENNDQFKEFISNPESEKLYESESILIGQTKSQSTNLVSVPQRNNSLGVATEYRLWKWPIFFEDHDHEFINVSPENNARLELQVVNSYSTEVNMKFDFFKKEFKYTFHGINKLFTQLGGSSGVAEESLAGLGALFLLLWMFQFCLYLVMKH